MTVLTAILTHLDASLTEAQLAYLRALSPKSRFVICHGGRRSDFERLANKDAVFIDDPSLRGPHFEQSLDATLQTLYESHVREEPSVEFVYVIEYDHLILAGDFERRLAELAERSGAGLLAKSASPRNDSNWPHFLLTRDDRRLNDFIAAISCREDTQQRWGCLGDGMLFRRDALAAFCSMDDKPSRYFELFVPTVVHHLGFDVVDVDAVSDLYMALRWVPEFTVAEAKAEKRAGRTFLHPFKRLDALHAVLAA